MKKVDIVILGGASTGSYFARRMAEKGHSVLVIEKDSMELVGSKYDIFHISKADFSKFGLPLPVEGEDKAFEFEGGMSLSAFGHYPKMTGGTTIGMHMHDYILRMNMWAQEAGAVYEYDARFSDFIIKDGKIQGVRYEKDGIVSEIKARMVADCSGIGAVGRTNLPENYGIEKFKLGPTDLFYVILRYVSYKNEKDYVRKSRSWTYFKTWEAPQADPHGAILGIGANLSFETGEKIFEEFEKTIELPKYELQYKEKGITPYRRPPYSFVADGFVVLGDAACLTKPNAGEGVTSSMVQADIVIDKVHELLQKPEYLSTDLLWPINKTYYNGQGKVFAGMLATLIGAVSSSAKENEYFFKKDIIFSEKALSGIGEGKPLSYSVKEMMAMGFKMAIGVISGNITVKTIKVLLNSMKNGDRITKIYADYPETKEALASWVEKADAAWKKCGSMADQLIK